MPETLLIIDGRGRPDALVRALEADGYFCVYARGPLKAKALLKEHPVALIVWKDNTGNPELSKDLARIWEAHPKTPVVHLIASGARVGMGKVGPQVRATFPVEVRDTQLLETIRAALATQGPAALGELAVLGAAAGGTTARYSGTEGSRGPAIGAVFAPTGISADERQFLYGPLPGSGSGLPRLVQWVRSRLPWLSAGAAEP